MQGGRGAAHRTRQYSERVRTALRVVDVLRRRGRRGRGAARGGRTRTPLERNARLSDATGAQVWLKREDLQVGRSYKVRGAYNLIGPARRGRAGGRRRVRQRRQPRPGRGLRLPAARHPRPRLPAAHHAPAEARPDRSPSAATTVELVVVGDTYDEAAAAAAEHAARTGATLVPAFDDPRTIAGQGTSASRSSSSWAGRPTWSWCRSAAAGCSPASRRGCASGTRRSGSSGSSRPGRRAWRRAARPASRWRCRRSTPSSTAPPCAASARSPTRWCATRGAELVDRRRGRGLHRDARALPDRRDHRRARRRPGHRRAGDGVDRRARADGGVHGVRRQQRRQPLRRDRRALAGAPRAQALLPGRVPAGAGRAAPVPRRGARARTTTSRCSSTSSGTTARPAPRWSASRSAAGRATSRCGSAWRPARCGSSTWPPARPPTGS